MNLKFIANKNITTNIYRILASDSIMCGYFSVGLTNFVLKHKSLLDYTKLFSPNKYWKSSKIYWNIFGNSRLKISFMNRF